MQSLLNKIESLDGQPVAKYSLLCGYYRRGDIAYHIRAVTGGQVRSCAVDLEFPAARLIGSQYLPTDALPIASHILREFSLAAHMANDTMQQSESNVQKGLFLVYRCGNRVLANSAVRREGDSLFVRLTVRLPHNNTAFNTGTPPDEFSRGSSGSIGAMTAKERRDSFASRKKGVISAKALQLLLTKNLPALAEGFLDSFSPDSLAQSVQLWRNQNDLRGQMRRNGWVAFVANGAILPRRGKTDAKDARGALPFLSPPQLERSVTLPDGSEIAGMAIPAGITVITGDAYHGKSTLLNAIAEGIYNHVPHDGREYVLTDDSAQTIRAEDGRSIRNTDISFFLHDLPVPGLDPAHFTTDHASGSTSQAAALAEAVEAGCRLALFDEDRCANNFMIKDAAMRALLPSESTTPFTRNAPLFYARHGLSSILVMGASGEYFPIAHRVLLVNRFAVSLLSEGTPPPPPGRQHPSPRTADLSALRRLCLTRDMEIREDNTIRLGSELIRADELLSHPTRGQLDYICSFLLQLTTGKTAPGTPLPQLVNALSAEIAKNGPETIHQVTLRGATCIESVRAADLLRILWRMKEINL